MFRPFAHSHRRPPRRGVTLLFVLSFLVILTIVGLLFLLYSAQSLRVATYYRDGQSDTGKMNPDPNSTINLFFSQLIYDTDDDVTGVRSGLRGHSLGRAMYGKSPDPLPRWGGTPYNGVGIFHEPTIVGTDRAQQVNNTVVMVDTNADGVLDSPYLIDPEWTGSRPQQGNQLLPFANSLANRAYVSKAVGHTYPDLNNFAVAMVDPRTGEVTMPSFHRPWLTGPIAPGAAIWNAPDGKLRLIRPFPRDNPGFPYPGDATGDVKNLPGAPGGNDSIWIDINAPIITINGRAMKPLIAPLILPLDGLLNLSAHGNTHGQGGAHFSYAGYGAWEVNIGRVITGLANSEAERRALIGEQSNGWASGRGRPRAKNGTTTRPYDPYSPNGTDLPAYAPVGWPVSGSPVPTMTYPNGGSLTGLPGFANFQNTNASIEGPWMFNWTEWPDTPQFGTRVYSASDIKRMILRYAFTPDFHNQAEVALFAPTTLRGNQGTYQFLVAPQSTTLPQQAPPPPMQAYLRDPAHALRGQFTTLGYTLQRPAMTPTYLNLDATTALALDARAGQRKPVPGSQIYPAPTIPGAVSDFGIAGTSPRWVNMRAAIGSVDLNRAMADWRDLTSAPNVPNPQPLSPTNMSNAAQALADRQQLAGDIFVRLVVAAGAAGYVDPNTGALILPDPNSTPPYQLVIPGGTTVQYTVQNYDALRYLAQLAVNITDYIDNDDIMTPFVFNSISNTPNDPANYSTAQIGNRVVFGFELPRLVINEFYSEIDNDPADPVDGPPDPMTGAPQAPNGPVQVRFWLELLNPTSAASATANGPLGNGAVQLWAGTYSPYQIQLSRAYRTTGVPMGQDVDLAGYLSNPANTTGRLGLPSVAFATPDATFTFSATTISVNPNGGAYAPATPLPANGIVLVGPPTAAKGDEFNPAGAGGVWANQNYIQSGQLGPARTSTGMGYTVPIQPAATFSTTEFRDQAALLRRLANPYLPPNDPAGTFDPSLPVNPYITVDWITGPSFDATHRGMGQGANRNPRGAMNANGYDPVAERFSVGKMQPYAGRSVATIRNGAPGMPNYNVYNGNTGYGVNSNLQNSMVRDQTTVPPMPNNEKAPKNTFGRHNGATGAPPAGPTWTAGAPATLTDTIMAPYDWLVHLDRKVVNQAELLQVRDSKPHLVTNEFIVPTPNAPPGVTYDTSYVGWQSPNMRRALEFLTVRPWTQGVPHGGRVAGQINLNVTQSDQIFLALLDPPNVGAFTDPFVTNLWQNWSSTRTPTVLPNRTLPNGTPVQVRRPDATMLETLGGTGDAPFLPFGAPAVVGGSPFAYFSGNFDYSILRNNPVGSPSRPALYLGSPTDHSYLQTEALRKMLNNSTTRSSVFAVFLTIGYFEVTDPDPVRPLPPHVNWPVNIPPPNRLGNEVYNIVPGDMRVKVNAIIDMSMMALNADPTVPPAPATVLPFFTSLEQTAYAGSTTLSIAYTQHNPGSSLVVASDGVDVAITPGTKLVLGYGVEQQVVDVTAIGPAGSPTVTISPALTRTAWGGSCVSNVRPGYADPQPGFSVTAPTSKPLVPYYELIR